MSERPSGPLDDLDERLKRLRAREGSEPRSRRGNVAASGIGLGLRIGTELVAALLVGCGIGYLLDRWLGTLPWLSLVFFILGSTAGMLNVYRLMTKQGYAAGYKRPTPPIDEQDSDENP